MASNLAIFGGSPVRNEILPYGHQWVDTDDLNAVHSVLQSEYLTTGPMVEKFENAFSEFTGSTHAIAVSSGTAALHAAIHAIDISPGDEVIVPAITFAATANCVIFQRGRPVFADVDSETLLIDPESVAERITPQTKAVLFVDFAGQPCDFETLGEIARENDCFLVDDACHALGGKKNGHQVGTLADLSTFSFHPVKHITTGEGGMVTTNHPELAQKVRYFRNHGISRDHSHRALLETWFYEMESLGFNYRMNDIQAALGNSQIKKLNSWLNRRRMIARTYNEAFTGNRLIIPLRTLDDAEHAYHLYVVRLQLDQLKADRTLIFKALRAEGIGVNVHYIPVHLHPFYRKQFGTGPGLCPIAETAYEEILTLPLFPRMSDEDVADVIEAVNKVLEGFAR